jgi:hypothetical protein
MDRTDSDDIEHGIRAEVRAEIHSEPQPDHWLGALCHSLGLSVGTAKSVAAIALGVVLGSGFSVVFGLNISLSETDPLLLAGGYLLFVTALIVLVGTVNNHSGNEVGDWMR